MLIWIMRFIAVDRSTAIPSTKVEKKVCPTHYIYRLFVFLNSKRPILKEKASIYLLRLHFDDKTSFYYIEMIGWETKTRSMHHIPRVSIHLFIKTYVSLEFNCDTTKGSQAKCLSSSVIIVFFV